MITVMKRRLAVGASAEKVYHLMPLFAGSVEIEGVHPIEGGFFRKKNRLGRMPGLPIVPAWRFYPAFAWETLVKHIRWGYRLANLYPTYRRLKKDPNRRKYTDLAMQEAQSGIENLDLISQTRGGQEALDKKRIDTIRIDEAKAAAAAN